MSQKEHSTNRRDTINVVVTVHTERDKIPASLIDLKGDSIVLVLEKKIMPDTEVDITVDRIEDFAIHGKTRLLMINNGEGKLKYRIGIEADQILSPKGFLEKITPQTVK